MIVELSFDLRSCVLIDDQFRTSTVRLVETFLFLSLFRVYVPFLISGITKFHSPESENGSTRSFIAFLKIDLRTATRRERERERAAPDNDILFTCRAHNSRTGASIVRPYQRAYLDHVVES